MLLRYPLILLPLLAALAGRAQTTNRVAVKPPLTRATVYLNGTTLEHQAPVVLAAGLNRVLVSGLSPRLDDEAMEVQLGEGAELLAIDDTGDELLPPAAPLNPTAVDSLKRAEAERRTLDGELDGLKQEKAFLLANQTLPSGTQANWSAEVQRGATLMRTRLPAIQQEAERTETRLAELKPLIAALQPRASETGARDLQVLVVRAARAGTVLLTVHYFLSARSPWRPMLDIRANASGREVKFVTHGLLANRTGLPWVRLPVVLMRYEVGDVSRPELVPWELDFNGGDHNGEGRIDEYVVKGTAKGRPAAVTQGTRYELPEPVTLAVNSRRELSLPAVPLPARPEYLAVPRVAEQVVLQTKVSGWEGLQLPTYAKVYHDGVYVGRTDLEDRAFNDSLEVALGTDPQLVVGRAKLEDFSSNVPLSDKRRVRLTYELNVQNRHPEAVRLRLLDEVPISEEKEISVKVLEDSGAERDERTGKLTWLLTLPPGSSQRLRFSFQVDYPKDKTVEIINHRVRISNPKFR